MKIASNKILRTVAVLGLLALVPLLAACTKSAPSNSGATQQAPTSSDAVAAPTVKLLTPTASSEVAAGDLTVKVETSGLKFTMPSNTNVPGEGHVHFTLDDRPFQMSVEPQAEIKDVAPGVHTLKAELVQNNTKSLDPPVVEVIEFTAK
jgi:hypothetical protein